MNLLVYNLLLLLLSPPLLLFLLWRLANGKEDLAHWGERWGAFPLDVAQSRGASPRFWVHAVSVGEVMAAAPVLRELRQRFPDALIVLSTTTIGGREVAQKQPPADEVLYYPLDFPLVIDRALRTVRPDVVLLMEWEIWPNFLTRAKRQGAKIAVLNGRISDRGLRRGQSRFAAFFTAPGLASVDRFAMQSEEDSRRAALVGADPARIETLGNTKFDESMTPLTSADRDALRADLGIPPGVPVWVCGSTREGEEALIAEAAQKIWQRVPNLFLIVAPRHLTRADDAAAALETTGRGVRRRSTTASPPLVPRLPGSPDPPRRGARRGDVLLLDTFGELARVYAVADAAFVGGSLLPFGGQSVFQPLAQGVPALFGPYMNNQRDIAALAKAEGAGFEVADTAQLAAEVTRLVSRSEEEKAEMSRRARALIERNQGVAVRCVDRVATLLRERTP
ncbi:MAG: 3-deoxy-D-manno-octulosonic acid transferase [Cytophagales bacterium]|nr:3-deoxy-D-manno-octulosonic acid transferase [Armatimonadota bacterium]